MMVYIVGRPTKYENSAWRVIEIERFDTETWPRNYEVSCTNHGDNINGAQQEVDMLNGKAA